MYGGPLALVRADFAGFGASATFLFETSFGSQINLNASWSTTKTLIQSLQTEELTICSHISTLFLSKRDYGRVISLRLILEAGAISTPDLIINGSLEP